MQGLVLALGFAAMALSWLAPGHYPPWPSFQAEFLACIAGCLIAVCVVVHRKARWPWLAAVALLTAAVPLLQTAFGQILFVSDGVLSAAYVAAFSLSIVAGMTLVATRRCELLDGLMAAFVVAAIVSTGIALAQWLQVGHDLYVTDLRPGDRPYANLAQPNHLATLLALGIVGLLRWFEARRIGRFVASLAVAWLGIGLVLTQSRTGWFFVALLVVWCAAGAHRARLRLRLPAVAVGAAAFAMSVVSLAAVNNALLLAPLGVSLEEHAKSGVRWVHWETLTDALLRAPWSGYGWSQVTLAQQAAAQNHPITGEQLLNSHNLVLDLLLWNGIPLGALLVAAIVAWFVQQVRACRSADQWVLLAGVGAVFLHGLVEYPLNYMYFLLPTGLMMGALDGLNGQRHGWSVARPSFAMPLAILVSLLAWVSVEYAKVETAAWQLRMVSARIGVDRVSTAPPPDVVLLDAPREFQRFAITEARPGMSAQELDWMRRVSHRYAYAPSMLRFALAAGLNGHRKEAAHTLVLLCKMNTAERCEEGRAAWRALQQQYAVLDDVTMPAREAANP